jgi:hypothetical protein
MSAERSWGADTVALGRKTGSEEARLEPQRRRVSRPKLPPLGPRALSLGALALVVAAALIATLGGGTKSPPAPIREAADPAPQIVVKPPTRMRRRELHGGSKPRVHRKGAGQLEDEREPKASATAHELDAPEPAPEAAEPTIEPAPEAPPPVPTPAPAPPTSATAEFGL